MFAFDPISGRKRRNLARDRVAGALMDLSALAREAELELAARRHQALAAAPLAGSLAPTAIATRAAGELGAPGRIEPFAPGRPAYRLAEGGVGGLIALAGLLRGGLLGRGVAIAGAYVVSQAVAPPAAITAPAAGPALAATSHEEMEDADVVDVVAQAPLPAELRQ